VSDGAWRIEGGHRSALLYRAAFFGGGILKGIMLRPLFALAFVPILSLTACDRLKTVPPPPQEVIIRVASDPGKPLEGVELLNNGKKVATTDATGTAKLTLTGKDGETFDLFVRCPDGFQSPTKPVPILLRRLLDVSKKPEYEAACPPTTRTVVVAVRAENGPNLPITHLGREVGRTDAAGAAHVLLNVKPDESFSLTLNTTEKGKERLRPQNPVASFSVKDHDDVLVFDKKFEQERVFGAPKRRGPVKIR
jgi:hypothetical protein